MTQRGKSISREEALAQLQAVADGTWGEKYNPGDEWYSRPPSEGSHIVADGILLQLVNDPEITAAYHAIEKWYA